MMNLIVLDTETTGLKADSQHILQVAYQRIEVTGKKIGDRVTYRFKPTPEIISSAEPKALEVNGFKWEDYEKAPLIGSTEYKAIWTQIYLDLCEAVLMGHFIRFDKNFLEATFTKLGMERPFKLMEIDTKKLAKGFMPKGESLSLINVYKALGGPSLPEHVAWADVEKCIYLYRQFLETTGFMYFLDTSIKDLEAPTSSEYVATNT